jgi:hypothetical protein
VLIEVKFVLADEGRQIYGVEDRQRIAKGIPSGGFVCDIPAGCEILPQLHSDGTKLERRLGRKNY